MELLDDKYSNIWSNCFEVCEVTLALKPCGMFPSAGKPNLLKIISESQERVPLKGKGGGVTAESY